MAVAIIGMSCRFPDANSPEEFWKNLLDGKDSVRSIPTERWYMAGEDDLVAGYLKCPLDEFDSNFFNISPKEAAYIDPQQRLFLEVGWESLENARISPTSLDGSDTGIWLGIGNDDYFRCQMDQREDTIYKVLGNTFSSAAGRLSHFLNVTGPSVAVEAACASSAVAIHLACMSLRNGECNLALAGGVTTLLEAGTAYPSALVSTRCKTFDASANGFAPAEGCGVLVMKLLEQAVEDGDRIHAVIRGSAMNHTGKSSSFGTPNSSMQQKVIRNALKSAGVKPNEVSFLETHGTGTTVGDYTETQTIQSVYNNAEDPRLKPLVLGAVKTCIGHPLAAAGVAGLIKMILCMQHNQIPKHLHLKTLNPRIDLELIPATIPGETMEWVPNSDTTLIGGVSSFGITGTNVHFVMEKFSPISRTKEQVGSTIPSTQLICISAKDEGSLANLSQAYVEMLEKDTQIDFTDFAFSINTTRSHHPYRIALVAKNAEEFGQKLKQSDYVKGTVHETTSQPIVFLFTGHGCQYFGMAKSLYETSQTFKATFDSCDTVFQEFLGQSLRNFIWDDSEQDMNRTKYSQPAIFCIQICLAEIWRSFGIVPDLVLGHSIGEFAASVVAGLISFRDGMKLVCGRSILVDQLPESRMMAISTSLPQMQRLIYEFGQSNQHWIDVATVNSPVQTVVSGSIDGIREFKEFCLNQQPGLQMKILASQHAFHSREMDKVLDEFETIASEVQALEPTCTYLSGTTATLISRQDLTPKFWRNHLRNTVQFSDATNWVLENGYKTFVEIGPNPVLLNFIMEANQEKQQLIACPSLRRGQDSWTTLLTSLSRLHVGGVGNINYSNISPGHRIDLPTYPFNRKKCWAAPAQKVSSINGTNKMVHPLLGSRVRLPEMKDTRYSNSHSLSTTTYMKDHVVCGHAIIPAAGFLEMLMAIGLDSGARTGSIHIENLKVARPLLLENKPRQVHAIASKPDDESVYKVGFFTESGENWLQHAQGEVRLDEAFTPKQPPSINVELTKKRCSETQSVQDIYERLAAAGINFGTTFQSIESFCHNPEKTEIFGPVTKLAQLETDYICHPIVLDAMIQTYYQYKSIGTNEQQFCLPVSIRSFTWYGLRQLKPAGNLYIHMTDETTVSLCTEQGEVLGVMEGVTLLETTQMGFLKSLDLPSTLPQFMTRDWVRVPDNAGHINTELQNIPNISEIQVQKHVEICKKWMLEHASVEEFYSKLCFKYVVMALIELGWKPEIGNRFSKDDLAKLVNLEASFDIRVLDRFLAILVEEGVLEANGIIDEFVIIRDSAAILGMDLNFEESEKNSTEYKFCTTMGEALPRILRGQVSAVEVMFKDNDISSVYSEFRQCQFDYKILVESFQAIFGNSTELLAKNKLRILEVGAGTGGATQPLLECLTQLDIPFQYTYTDVVPVFVSNAKKRFAKMNGNMTFEVLDLEKDPKLQGFTPNSYDVIIASNVVHATEDLTVSLGNIRHLLTESGFFFLIEMIEPFRGYALSFELLPSYWKAKDFRTYPVVNSSVWMKLLLENGFTDAVNAVPVNGNTRGIMVSRGSNAPVEYKPIETKKSWIICSDTTDLSVAPLAEMFKNAGRQVVNVHPGDNFQKVNKTFEVNPKRFSEFQQLSHILKNVEVEGIVFQWGLTKRYGSDGDLRKTQEIFMSGLLNMLKVVVTREWKSRLYLVTSGAESQNPDSAPMWGILGTFLNEYPEYSAVGIDLEPGTDPVLAATQIFNRLWSPIVEIGFVYKNGDLHVARMHNFESELPLPEISIPKTPSFKLVDARDFTFNTLPVISLDGAQIEIAVRAVGLNFRDLLLSSGLLPVTDVGSAGLEFAGIVTRSCSTEYGAGDRVVGLVADGALGSHVVVNGPELLLPIAKGMTFTEAATLPVAFGTCYVSLIEIAKLKKGEKLLIHTGTGGVGLAGIQLARHLGAEVYVTAGNRRKRNYLKHCIGITNVYDSRTTEFSEQILADTAGHGVDVVLNTITGPGFKEASLACLAKTGRFIELSKLNIWSVEDVVEIRPDVQYTILDAYQMIQKVDRDMVHTFAELRKLFTSGKLKSLPHTTYALSQLKSAFQFFHKHQHIGKVIVEVHETAQLSAKTLFSSESSYLVTGGLGGLGFQVVKFITDNGGNVVILGRTPPNEEMVEKLKSMGSSVTFVQGDVGDLDTVQRTITSVSKPLRGIFHCSGVFSNNFVVNQTMESFNRVFQPKVYGTWNLHECTKTLDLTYFVVFSSIASLVGSTGLSNYTAGNRYMDSLIAYRTEELGLPGMTLNWGPWAEVGAAAGYVLGMFKSFQHFSPEVGIKSLERVLQLNPTQMVIADMDPNISETTPKLKAMLSELTGGNFGARRRSGTKYSVGLSSMDSKLEAVAKEVLASSAEEMVERMENLVELCFRAHAGLSESDTLDRDQPLTFMGLDSLIGMEVRTRLSKILEIAIPTNLIQEHNSVRALSRFLAETVIGDRVDTEVPVADVTATEIPLAPVPTAESKPKEPEISLPVVEKKGKLKSKSKPISRMFSKGLQRLHSTSDKGQKNPITMK